MSDSPPEQSTTERLFDGAAGLFRRQGFAATTTREIAAAVGIQQASLYHHMESKEELLYRICVSSLNRFLAEVPAAVASAPPEERLPALVRAHVGLLLRHQQRNVTSLLELRSLSARHRAGVLALRDDYERFSRATLAASGIVRADVSARYLSLALMSMLNYAALWFRKGRALAEDQLAAIFTQVFLGGAAAAGIRESLRLPDFSCEEKKPIARARKAVTDNPGLARAVDAAVGLFSRKGYAATSTREVANLLGIQKASLYYHVESKEDLLFLICRFSLEQIRKDVDAAVGDVQDPLGRVAAMIGAHVESLLRDEAKHTTTFAEMNSLSENRRAEVIGLRRLHEDLIRRVLEDGQKAGVVRADIEVKYLCLALLGLMNRVTVWYRRNGPLSPNQVGRLLAVLFLGGAGGV